MRYKFKLDGKKYDVQTSGIAYTPGDGSTVLRTYDTETLRSFLTLYADEFRKLQEHRKMTDLMIERITATDEKLEQNKEFRAFHFHLDVIHEFWLRGVIV